MISLEKYPKYFQKIRNRQDFNKFSDEEADVLYNNMKIVEYHKGDVLFTEEDERNRFYYVYSGLVRSERTNDIEDFTFYSYINDRLGFPYVGLFSDNHYSYSARVMTESIIIHFPMVTFENLLKRNNDSMVTVVKEMSDIINSTEKEVQNMVTSSGRQRIYQALKLLHVHLGQVNNRGQVYLPYSMTIKELGTISGVSRETTGRVVADLVDNRYLKYEHKRFTFYSKFTKK